MVRVKEINWLSHEVLEAEVTITNGRFDLLCFGYPFKIREADKLEESLLAFDSDEII